MSKLQWDNNPATPTHIADVPGKGRMLILRHGAAWYAVEVIDSVGKREFVNDFVTLKGAFAGAEREAEERGWV